MEINISVFGEAAIHRRLINFRDRLIDASPVFFVLASEFYASETQQFDSEGRWGSGGWPPLAAATVAAKEEEGFDTRILHRTLALRDSLTDPDSEGAVLRIRSDELFIGSNIDYGKYHQQVPYRSDWLPMRKPVELPDNVKAGMVKTLQTFLVHGVLP